MNADPTRLLIVDDDADFRLMLRVQLGLEPDLEVVGEASDGQEAVDLCAHLTPDAVVMDVLMPVMDGLRAAELIGIARPSTRVIAYSAVAGDYVRARTREMGLPLVLKSGDIQALIGVLRGAEPAPLD